MNAIPYVPPQPTRFPWKALLAATVLGAIWLFLLARLDSTRLLLSEATMVLPDSYRTPIRAISPPKPPFLGGVLLLHGYGGSKEVMQSLATDLALEGFYTFSLDLPGCGDSNIGFQRKELLPAISSAYENLLGRALLTPGKVAVIGHSMGGGLALQFAREHPEVQATVLLSSVPGEVTPDAPRNLLLITAEFEKSGLKEAAARMLRDSTPKNTPPPGVTVGDFASGSARRAVEAPGVNHLTILYSDTVSRESREWIRQSFSKDLPAKTLDSRSGIVVASLAVALLLFATLVVLAVYFFTPAVERVEVSHLSTKRDLLVLTAACLAACGVAALLPGRPWIPIHMVDYVATACALAGVAITLSAYFFGVRIAWELPSWRHWSRPLALALGGFLFLYWNVGLEVNHHWLRMSLAGGRWEIAARAALLLAPLVFCQELISRELQQRRGFWRAWLASALMNGILLAALLIPALLRLGSIDPFLLLMSAPFLAGFFLFIPFLAAWLYRASSSVLLSATWTTLMYAWLFTATPFWK